MNTLRQHITGGDTVWAYCNSCHHNRPLDLEAIAAKLGIDHGALHTDLVPKMRCTKCRSKNVAIRLLSGRVPRTG